MAVPLAVSAESKDAEGLSWVERERAAVALGEGVKEAELQAVAQDEGVGVARKCRDALGRAVAVRESRGGSVELAHGDTAGVPECAGAVAELSGLAAPLPVPARAAVEGVGARVAHPVEAALDEARGADEAVEPVSALKVGAEEAEAGADALGARVRSEDALARDCRVAAARAEDDGEVEALAAGASEAAVVGVKPPLLPLALGEGRELAEGDAGGLKVPAAEEEERREGVAPAVAEAPKLRVPAPEPAAELLGIKVGKAEALGAVNEASGEGLKVGSAVALPLPEGLREALCVMAAAAEGVALVGALKVGGAEVEGRALGGAGCVCREVGVALSDGALALGGALGGGVWLGSCVGAALCVRPLALVAGEAVTRAALVAAAVRVPSMPPLVKVGVPCRLTEEQAEGLGMGGEAVER